jgi:predicted MFS family arabinose efflux permease
MEAAFDGSASPRIIAVLACVLGLQTADLGTIGAVGGELESSFGIGHAELGLLAAASSLVGACVTLPFGILADRVRRVPMLAAVVALWGLATGLSAIASSYSMLLVVRVGLGATAAAAGPFVASLAGDYFPPAERARTYGYILSGELVGAAFGFLVSGDIAGALSWRWAFAVLALPALVLAWLLPRLLGEPPRGRQRGIAVRGESGSHGRPPERRRFHGAARDRVRSAVVEHEVDPRRDLVVRVDPARLGFGDAVRYVLRVPTNVRLIVASSLGYFFLSGVETFGVIFMRKGFDLSQAAATSLLSTVGIGALVGVLVGGRVADARLRRGELRARALVGAVGYLLAALLFAPPLALAAPLLVALPLFIVATGALSAASPPLDAARLDIMPSRMWGRAEAVRTVLRTLAIGGAPLLFGLLAGQWTSSAAGLRWTFLIMLAPLALAAITLRRAARTYPRDVATALASEAVSRDGR